ncbi:glycerophosphodiester phosphodiesterase [Sphaerisporangium perillae]|uniref:glycerophosphodiester phosphodiesterase n=1 Tax=Sphaerisporangium perillae TaxID=2935860 RepID=UPI00200D8736|nr:glycerophosphodiester phosphodiesterase family protein [Sphaerisporangium perillae]
MLRRLGLTITTTLVALTAAVPTATAAPTSTITNVAHRGASAQAPENTIAAFKLAEQQHADMFELDIRETKDHQLVVMHDKTLTRTTNVARVFPDRAPWRVGDLTLAEIQKLDAGSWFARKYSGERVPTLAETLRAMDGSRLGLLLEIKSPRLSPGIEARVARELRQNPSWLRPGRLVVQSFNWDSMRKFHQEIPEVPIGLLGTPTPAQIPELAGFASHIDTPYKRLTSEYIQGVHRHHMKVFAYTVDDPDIMRRLISDRVDGVITNRPNVIHALVEPRATGPS